MHRSSNLPTNRLPDAAVQATTMAADRVLDITGETCPMTFVRTRLALDAMLPGQTLLVKLRGAEPVARVPATARSLGHAIMAQDQQEDGSVWLTLRRG